ncbi:MAG: NAD(+)/NADH kinase [Alicyclobacillus sp.]|nr:NAD(+)/NADH kinase [Alicyclobacillus sp.]
MRTFAILVNPNKPGVREIAAALHQNLAAQGMASVEWDIASLGTDSPERVRDVELAFVLGGDGTLLGVARDLAEWDVPLLGINVGHLGFLSEADPGSLVDTVRRVRDRAYDLERRMMLAARICRSGCEDVRHVALNDIGIGKGALARMVQVDVHVDGVLADSFRGDGVIVSTPTGSTAYSLSCGGPILAPHLQVMLITPVCAHSLVSRPCVVGGEQVVQLVVRAAHRDLGLTVDGQVGVPLLPGDEVEIRRAPVAATLVKWRDRQFFQVLRTKLRHANQ